MVKVLKFLAYILFFIVMIIYFMPKSNLYYFAEQELEKNKVIFSNEEIKDNGLSLNIDNIDVSFEGIESANVQSVNLKTFLVYNSLNVENIKLSDMAASFVPLVIENVNVSYSILNPLNVVASANGEFGEASAAFNILDSNLSILLMPSPLMLKKYKNTLRQMKKNESGEYVYVKTF